ncbi:MAG: tRNA uridine-5-carboxymethylaminomethyl(34) synthesis enzyme MnmG [Planctomycetes bacterium]|nr:tRNA uridine-5-carboxymethylaminomethyl(34) synthesis enzyme MnmG [Planctomycetota bacterium]
MASGIAREFDVIVIGGGHAGAEAAWAAANLGARTALISMDPSRTGAMSCNPAIGGLAKGQMVREIDALGGLMALATDATGIQFRMLNASKGPAVWGPRAQCDKYAYAKEVQRLLSTREEITIIAGVVEGLAVERGRITGVHCKIDHEYHAPRESADCCGEFGAIDIAEKPIFLAAKAVVLTTGTFMRGLMHTGERKTEGGRVGEGSAVGISGALRGLGFELGRLKTGTPPRLAAETIDFSSLVLQPGDDPPVPFSDMTMDKFPVLEQKPCYLTHTCESTHELIRANLHRAPMYNGQIETSGPRYCPSIEDKVVRFAQRTSHHVYLEPESLSTNEIYCNGISTSLPADVQDVIVRNMPGCANAKILRHGYAVEYDMVWPHQIDATGMTKLVAGLFLAGQINGTSGYEEAAGQGLIAGLNAVRFLRGSDPVRLGRDQSYIGVLMDDLVTKTPREPYRMFTSRAEHRLLLRADNADERLTELGRGLGLVDDARWAVYQRRSAVIGALKEYMSRTMYEGGRLVDWARRSEVDAAMLTAAIAPALQSNGQSQWAQRQLVARVLADVQYEGYVRRQKREVAKMAAQEQTRLPTDYDYGRLTGLRREAVHVLSRFRPATLGQAGRLAGVTPADIMLLTVTIGR